MEYRRRWKISDPGADAIIDANVAVYDKLREHITRRCGAKDCDYMISSFETCFAVPGYGDVCRCCYDMYQALMAPGLKDKFYWLNLHNRWREENDPDKIKRDRRRLGLDE